MAYIRIIFFLCLVMVLAQASLILSSWGKLPPQLPLFYSKPWGEAILAPPIALWILPGIALLGTAVNFALIFLLVTGESFLVRILLIFSLLVAVITLYGTVKIISLLI